MKVKILSRKMKAFKTDEGELVDYYWYKCLRLSDEVTIQVGSLEGGHEIGTTLDLNIEKTEKGNGKYGYKEVKD